MARLTGDRLVDRRKIEDYLLNPDPGGVSAKAGFFIGFGFTRRDWPILLRAIAEHPATNPVVATEENQFGLKTIIECSLTTPDGRHPCIRTIWIVDRGETLHRFVTAYPIVRPTD